MNNSVYGCYRTRTFSDIFPDVGEFTSQVTDSEIPLMIQEGNLSTLYYLLYAKYGNSSISSSDENQFKYKVFSTIFMYGPAWEKRLEIQQKLIALTEEDIMKGSQAIYNTAHNPSTAPTTGTLDEIPYINAQNTTKFKKSKLEGYALLTELIKSDVTAQFLDKFKGFFLTVVAPQEPLYYITEIEGEN